MSRLLVFQHVAAEPLGTLDRLIRRRGHRIRFVNFEREPDADPDVEPYRGLIVLGGPMNVHDRAQRAHLLLEMRAIEKMLQQGKPVLGICLGAQLLAHVLGAPVERSPTPEIGWYRLNTTGPGRSDSVLAPLGEASEVFQWHSCRFEIPRAAIHLASTETCAPQAFRYGKSAYGFQFHLEMDRPLIERWLRTPAYREELLAAGACADAIRIATTQHIEAMQGHAEAVFGAFLDLVGQPRRMFVLPSREWD